jgi:hypothetical protein
VRPLGAENDKAFALINPHISRTLRGGVKRRARVGFPTGHGRPSFLEWGLLG